MIPDSSMIVPFTDNFNLSSIILIGEPGTTGYLEFRCEEIINLDLDIELQNSYFMYVEAELRECLPGEVYSIMRDAVRKKNYHACNYCGINYYSIE